VLSDHLLRFQPFSQQPLLSRFVHCHGPTFGHSGFLVGQIHFVVRESLTSKLHPLLPPSPGPSGWKLWQAQCKNNSITEGSDKTLRFIYPAQDILVNSSWLMVPPPLAFIFSSAVNFYI
jgi:hypothetical protein